MIGPHSGDLISDDVHIKSVASNGSRLARMTGTVWRILMRALKEGADVYHFHDPELIPVGLILRAAGKNVIYDIHEDFPKDVLSKYYLPSWSRAGISRVTEIIEGFACSRFTALVTVTPTIAERFFAVNRRTVVIHNYPYVGELSLPENHVAWKNRRQSLAYVGGITAQRGIREMVEAMALLPESLGATLELAGNEIPQGIRPEELYEHPGWRHVLHHGFMDRSHTLNLLNNIRAGLVCLHPEPNHLDSLPIKIFEYMGAGIPIIASNFQTWRDLMDDIGCAIFVDPFKPCEIAKAIEYILTHPAEAEEMGRRGRAAVVDRFNWDAEAEKLVDLYTELTNTTCVE